MDNKVDFVYFDVGQVLSSIKNGWEELCGEYGLEEEQKEQFWEVWGKYSDEICALRMTSAEFNQKVEDEVRWKVPEGFDITRETVGRFERIQPSYDLVNDVYEKYLTGLFSNAYPGMLDELMKKDLIPKLEYKVVVDSAELGMIKPEESIYEVAENRAVVDPRSILFVDNSLVNIQVADKRGWQTYLFSEDRAEECVLELRKMLLD